MNLRKNATFLFNLGYCFFADVPNQVRLLVVRKKEKFS